VLIAAINALWQARIHKQDLDHQRKVALQARITGAYEEMLVMVGWQMEVVDVTKPIWSEREPPEPPAEPDKETIRRVQARIGLHGSPEAKQILERWVAVRNTFFGDAWNLNRMQNDKMTKDFKFGYPLISRPNSR
jgi:hypothetical protein